MASYVEKTLIKGERIIHRSFLHWWLLVSRMIWGMIFLFVGLGMLNGKDSKVGGVIFLVLGIVVIGVGLMRKSVDEFVVTNKRLVLKQGLLRTRSYEMNVGKVEGLIVEQGLFGKMLGYGSITVRGTGGHQERFSGITDPMVFRHNVQVVSDPSFEQDQAPALG